MHHASTNADDGRPNRAADGTDDPAIRTGNLTKRYGDGPAGILAVDGLDLAVQRGEVFGFLGPNGAGKSTTIDLLLDYTRPSEGSATVLGLDAQNDAEALRRRIGVLPEGYGLYDRLTGRRHLEFAIEWTDADDEPDASLERVGLDPADGDRAVGEYSKGMRQRLALAMALVGDPDLLLLDEPSSGMDPHGVRRLRSIVREEAARGTTVFFSSHVLGQVEAVCDRVGILSDGELVAVDAVEGLRETAGAGAELRVRVADGGTGEDDAVTDDLLDAVDGIEGVDAVAAEAGVVRVECADPRAKARVVARLVDEGVEVLDLDSEGASLEDVFAAYTTDGGIVGGDDSDGNGGEEDGDGGDRDSVGDADDRRDDDRDPFEEAVA